MKKILLILTVIFLVLAAGVVFGSEYAMSSKSWAGDPDSLINSLDPEHAPAPIIPHTGLMGLTEEGLPGARGSAAGGMSRELDTFPNYIDPSRLPGYVELETGVVY